MSGILGREGNVVICDELQAGEGAGRSLPEAALMERVLHAFVIDHASTDTIARDLGLDEAEVCRILDNSGWGR